MSGLYYLKVPAGAVGAFHDVTSPKIVDFLGGIPLYLSFDLEAVRVSGSATCTVHFELKWYSAAGAALTPWFQDIVVNATMTKTLYKYPVTPPTNAASGVCYIKITPAASPMQHTITISQLRLGKTALSADNTADVAAIGDGNRVRFSKIEKLGQVWSTQDNTSNLGYFATAVTINNKTCLQTSTNFTGGNQSTASGTVVGNVDSFIPVTAGERIFFAALVAPDSSVGPLGTTQLSVGFVNSAGVEIGARGYSAVITGGSDFQRIGNFVKVPDGAICAFFRLATYTNAYSTPHTAYVTSTEYMLCSAGPNQTVWPPFSPGPSSEAAATVGATWASNVSGRPSNLAGLNGSESLNNSQISIGSNGALVGGGGGQATLAGMGAGLWATEGRHPDSVFRGVTNLLFNGGLRLVDGNGWPLGLSRVGAAIGSWGYARNGGNEGPYVSWIGNSTGAPSYVQFEEFPAYPNSPYVVQMECARNLTAGNAYMTVNWYDAVGNYLGNSGALYATTTDWTLKNSGVVTSPANTAKGVPYLVMEYAAGSAVFRRIKIAGTGYGVTPFSDEKTLDYEVLTRAGTGVQVGDQRNLTAVGAMNLGYKFTGNISYSASQYSATISVGAGSAYLGVTVSYNAMSVGVSGSPGSTQNFFLYVDDPKMAGGTKTLYATTNSNVPFQNTARVYIGSATITFPASGTSTGGGTGGGGGCVVVESYLPDDEIAGDVRVFDSMVVSDPLTFKERRGIVSHSEPKLVECVRFVTESGIELECSTTAPIAVRDGSQVLAPNLFGQMIPVKDHGEYRHERVVLVQAIGLRWVQHITVEDTFFLAGKFPDRFVLHHNVKPTDTGL